MIIPSANFAEETMRSDVESKEIFEHGINIENARNLFAYAEIILKFYRVESKTFLEEALSSTSSTTLTAVGLRIHLPIMSNTTKYRKHRAKNTILRIEIISENISSILSAAKIKRHALFF